MRNGPVGRLLLLVTSVVLAAAGIALATAGLVAGGVPVAPGRAVRRPRRGAPVGRPPPVRRRLARLCVTRA